MIFGILEKLDPAQLEKALGDAEPDFHLEAVEPREDSLAELNADANKAIRGLKSPEFAADFQRLIRMVRMQRAADSPVPMTAPPSLARPPDEAAGVTPARFPRAAAAPPHHQDDQPIA